jgi:hypothetical protein
MNICPYCRKPVTKSENRVPGRTILICRSCGIFQVVGEADWQELNPDNLNAVCAKVEKIGQEEQEKRRQAREQETREAILNPTWMEQD